MLYKYKDVSLHRLHAELLSLEMKEGGMGITYTTKAFTRRFVFGLSELRNFISRQENKATVDAPGVYCVHAALAFYKKGMLCVSIHSAWGLRVARSGGKGNAKA